MLSVVAVSSAISSSSQRRPRAIDATKVQLAEAQGSDRQKAGSILAQDNIKLLRLNLDLCDVSMDQAPVRYRSRPKRVRGEGDMGAARNPTGQRVH